MKTTYTADELIIQETPGCVWIFSSLFLIVGGLFVYGSLGNFSNRSIVPFWLILITFLMGAIAVALGVWLIYRSPVTRLVFDRNDETLRYSTYGLTGKEQTIYDFTEIEMFRLIEEQDTEGDLIWSLGMDLSDGETIRVSSVPRHDEKFKRDLVFLANEFMDKQMPSANTVFELEDESREEMS